MTKFNGLIKSKTYALSLAAKIEKTYSYNAGAWKKELDAAKMLRNNWQYIAARPLLAAEVVAMANTEPLDASRPGFCMNKILNSK